MKSNTRSIPCCFFPTKVVMVDDNTALTDSLKCLLDDELTCFNDSIKALDFLSGYAPFISENYWLQAEHETELADGNFIQALSVDTKEIQSLRHEPCKYQDVSVLIMDYHMPNLNGLELLSKISDKPFKTILLTGEADHAIAVEAFNQGKIDYFLRKDEDNLSEKLNHIIKRCQYEYFCDMSKKSREIIAAYALFMTDKKTCECFYEKIKQNNISEFYLLNLWGNYLLLNPQKQKHYFCAYTQVQLNILAENASEDNAPADVIHDLITGERIPFFGEQTPYWKVEGKDWGQYMFKPEVIQTEAGNVYVGMR